MSFILLHAKLQFPSIIVVDVTAVGRINRVGLLLLPYEAWCSAPAHHVRHCEWSLLEMIGSNCGIMNDRHLYIYIYLLGRNEG